MHKYLHVAVCVGVSVANKLTVRVRNDTSQEIRQRQRRFSRSGSGVGDHSATVDN